MHDPYLYMETTDLWKKTLNASLKLPIVRVDRTSFLRKELQVYCTDEQIQLAIEDSPLKVLNKKTISKIADGCINYHTTNVCLVSALAGLPGGWFLAATIPADIAQFYGHVIALTQKLLYLYGWPDLRDENRELNDETLNILTLFVGVMMGSREAVRGVNLLAKALAEQVVKRLARVGLTKYAIYNISKQVGKWICIKLTRESFAKSASKVIPFIGAPISAMITYWTFKPMARKLKRQLESNMESK